MKAHETETPSRRAAFTLVELLVVIGLMAMLGTVSVTGYFSAVRGMSYRAAKVDTISLIRQAMQTCLIDQTPTAVLFYNHQTKVDEKDKAATKASTAGVAVAIKMVGRISSARDDILVDEFADWNRSYPIATSSAEVANDKGIRFYRMSELEKEVKQGIEDCSSIVSTLVEPVAFDQEYMLAYGMSAPYDDSYKGQVQGFCNRFEKTCMGNGIRYGHRIKNRNGIAWKAGDAYGVEIGIHELPRGFFYGGREASSAKIESAGAITFAPCDLDDFGQYLMDIDPISIYVYSGENRKVEIANINKNDLRDESE